MNLPPNRSSSSFHRLAALPWFAFVAAAFPVLFLFVHNRDQAAFADMAVPLVLAVGGAAALFALAFLAFRDTSYAGIIVAATCVIFFGFGPATTFASDVTGLVMRPRYTLPIAAFALLVTVFVAGRHRQHCRAAIARLNIFALILVAFLLQGFASRSLRDEALTPHLDDTKVARAWQPNPNLEKRRSRLRNIYYVILDGYARNDVLSRIYSFDNTAFTDDLSARGFTVNFQSRANYALTELSLASSLNGTLLDPVVSRSRGDRRPIYAMISQNAVADFLRKHGYSILNISSSWAPTRTMAAADENLRCAGVMSEFNMILARQTAAWPFIAEGSLKHNARLCQFELLGRTGSRTGPHFVFAHILMPHPPYLFGRHGEHRNDYSALGDENRWRDHHGYVDQLLFVNSAIRAVIDTILAADKSDPIIVLQSDHGTAASYGWRKLSVEFAKERMPILNAVRLPGIPEVPLSRFKTPANTFGTIFELYFDARATPVPDASFLSGLPDFYKFRRVDSALDSQ